jgi:hypothetical protein
MTLLKKKLSLLLTLTLSISLTSSSKAETVLLEKGNPAPYTGFLLDKETAQLSRVKIIEGEEAKKLNLSYEKSIQKYQSNELLYQTQVQTVLEQNDKLSRSLRDSQGMGTWERIGWFVGGIVITGAAVYGASQLRK